MLDWFEPLKKVRKKAVSCFTTPFKRIKLAYTQLYFMRKLQNKNKKVPKTGTFDVGVPGGIRTPDLLVRSQSLYPAELQAHFP